MILGKNVKELFDECWGLNSIELSILDFIFIDNMLENYVLFNHVFIVQMYFGPPDGLYS